MSTLPGRRSDHTAPDAGDRLLVYHRRAEEYRELIRRRCPDLEVLAVADETTLYDAVAGADILIAWRFPLQALAGSSRLRWIQLTVAGVDHLIPARERLQGIAVTTARGIHGAVIADYVLGVVVMLHWDFPRLLRQQQARQWQGRETAPLAGRTLGIVGLGAIGTEIARRATAFGLQVIGVKRTPAPIDGVSRVVGPDRLHEILRASDFLVLAVPETPETRRMIGEPELRAMRPTAFLVNIARGGVVDEAALVRALEDRWIAGAALDVFDQEPLPPDHRLWALENVIITPHIAGEPDEYIRRVVDIFVDNYARWRAGRPLRNTVDLARGY